MVSSVVQLKDLSRPKLLALKRKAEGLGLTPERYVLQLIEDDLSLDRRAQNTSFDELAAPFERALAGIPNDELDRLVNAARGRKTSPKHKR